MDDKSIQKNYIYNLAYQMLLVAAPLVTTPHISRALGSDGVGAVSYAESIVAYFTLFAKMGLTTYGQRTTSYLRDSVERRTIAFWNTKLLELCSSALTLGVYIVFALFQRQRALYLILSLNILAVSFDVTWFFQGMEEFGKIVLRNAVVKLLNIVYIFLAVRDRGDVGLYALGLAGFTLLGNVTLWGYLPRYLTKVPLAKLHPFRDIRTVLSLFIPTIAIQVYTVLDKTMIGLITRSDFENGYYEQAVKVSKTLLMIVTALGTVMVPRIGYYFAQRNESEIRRLMYRGYRFVWFLGVPLCLGLVMTAGNFVPWFYGPGYDKVRPLLQMLAFLILAIGVSNVTGFQYLVPTERQGLFTLSVVLGACLNFVLNMILIRRLQSVGAAVASVAAEMFVAAFQLFLVRREISPWRVVREGTNYYFAGAVMTAALWLLGRRLTASVVHSMVLMIAGAAVYFAVLLALGDPFVLENARWLLRRLRIRSGREP